MGDKAAPARLGVLVVDDDLTLARLLGDGLRAVGHSVEVTHSAAAARQIVMARADIGVVVSDIRMPGGDGLDLALELAAMVEELRAVSVVLITGHATIEDVARAVRTGAADFLRKPCRLSELAQAVERGMAKARARRESAMRQMTLDRRLADLEAERSDLIEQVQKAGQRLEALRGDLHHPELARDIIAVSHALRTPLNAIAGGAALLEARRGESAAPAAEIALLRDGVRQAVAAVELVEELQRLQATSAKRDAADIFQFADAARTSVLRYADVAHLRGVDLLPPDPGGPIVRVARARFERVLDLCVASALDSVASGGTIEASCGQALVANASWAWLTLVVASPNDARVADLPMTPELPASGTPHSRTQETLRFFVAQRIAELFGGRLTSCSGQDRSFAIRFALPCEL